MRTGPEWIVTVVAIFIAAVAWFIRSRQRIELLNFLRPERVADRAGLARVAGNGLYLIAVLVAAAGVALRYRLIGETAIATALTVGVLALTGWLLLRAQDCLKP